MTEKHRQHKDLAKTQGKFYPLQYEDLVEAQATCSEFGVAVTFEEVR